MYLIFAQTDQVYLIWAFALDLFERVVSGLVKRLSKPRGSGPVKSAYLNIFAGRVGSGQPDP